MQWTRVQRGQALRAAAAIAGYSNIGKWAADHHITLAIGYRCAQGLPVSERVERIVDSFVVETMITWHERVLMPAIHPEEALT